ncbi:MAG: hypothetical protein ACI9GW_001264 [Halieaceae bacterium]|jgi:hypothetical protein
MQIRRATMKLLLIATATLGTVACSPAGQTTSTALAAPSTPARVVSVAAGNLFPVQALPVADTTLYISAETFRI